MGTGSTLTEEGGKSLLRRFVDRAGRSNVVSALMSSPFGELEPQPVPPQQETTIMVNKDTRSQLHKFIRAKRFASYDEFIRWALTFIGDVPIGVIHSELRLSYGGGVRVAVTTSDGENRNG